MRKPRQLVEQILHPPGKCQVAEPHQVRLRGIRAQQVDRFRIKLLGIGRLRAEIQRELGQFLQRNRLVAADAAAIRWARSGVTRRPTSRPRSTTSRSRSRPSGT